MAVILLLAEVAHAEGPIPGSDDQAKANQNEEIEEKPSGALQRILLAREQKRMDLAETEIHALKTELQKARNNIVGIEARQLDATAVATALEQFRNDFQALSEVMVKDSAQTVPAYQKMEKSLNNLFQKCLFPENLLPTIGERQRTIAALDALYDTSSWPREPPSWAALLPLSQLQRGLDGVTPAVSQIRSVVSGSTSFVNTTLSVPLLTRLYEQDKESVLDVWRRIADRAELGIKDREQQIEQSKKAMVELDNVAEQQKKRSDTDATLSYTIWFMVLALVVLFIATRTFSPDIQALIFQQRTLVEMIGMAFLLLTIIVLGTGEKIDRAVLGTLLGTVGGYIFGQQMRARGPGEQDSKPAQPSEPVQPSTQAASLKRAAEAGGSVGNGAASNPTQVDTPLPGVTPAKRD
ncbi:hypothetical protein [Archangium lipolyticum]|uniref:hypothetical protein n=1 Tax=Archangium lipolyticum TaxID=2970465 RepID=UPI002149FA2F|nr:hypothetical protein [Archangium lipolyticum]